MEMSRKRVVAITIDNETLEIIKRLKEQGYNVSALMRKLIKEFYEAGKK